MAAFIVRRNTKLKKGENTRIERKEILKKVRKIYIVVFAFLSSTIEVARR